MEFLEQVSALERRARKTNMPPDELCRRAGINRATWQRWKAGTTLPQMRLWQRAVAVVEDAEDNAAEVA